MRTQASRGGGGDSCVMLRSAVFSCFPSPLLLSSVSPVWPLTREDASTWSASPAPITHLPRVSPDRLGLIYTCIQTWPDHRRPATSAGESPAHGAACRALVTSPSFFGLTVIVWTLTTLLKYHLPNVCINYILSTKIKSDALTMLTWVLQWLQICLKRIPTCS